MRLAYLVNQYPKTSHTFIRREIHALEKCGVCVERFSLRPTREKLVDNADQVERERTRAVLAIGAAHLISALLQTAVARRALFFHALRLALKIGWRSDRGVLRHLAYLAEAAVLLGWFSKDGIEHAHAHFGTNSAAVAMFCHALGGPRYSFTVHGPEEFERGRFLALNEKIARARFVVTVSEYGASQLRQCCGREQWNKIHVVRCGVDETLLDLPFTAIPKAPRLVCIGRLHEQKGQLVLLKAIARLRAEGVCSQVILVGDGPLRTRIESEIARLRVEDCVTLVGWASGAQVRNFILDARAMVLPSIAENLPVAIMETFALRRPVIVSNIAGIPELVESGISGWLVPPGSADALANAMREALMAPTAQLEAMGCAGAAHVAQCFNVHTEAQKLFALYQRQAR